jgi:hypothetical protein
MASVYTAGVRPGGFRVEELTMFELKNIRVKGRGRFRQPTLTASVCRETGDVTLRMDCHVNPEAWMEIRVPAASLSTVAAESMAAFVGEELVQLEAA